MFCRQSSMMTGKWLASRSAALRALPDGPPATVCNDGRLHGTALRGGSWSDWLGSDRGMAVRAQARWIAPSAADPFVSGTELSCIIMQANQTDRGDGRACR